MTHTAAIPDTLAALGGALLFRRRPLRRLLHSPSLKKRLPVLILILVISIFSVHLFTMEGGDLTGRLLLAGGISVAQVAYWLIFLFAVAEPVLNILLRSATFDEAELHWWPQWRSTSRIALLTAFVTTYVVHALSFALFVAVPGGEIIAGAAAITWGFLVLTLIVKDWWNNVTSQALLIATGPTFVFFTALFLLSYPWPVPLAAAILCLALTPLTMRDIALRRKARQSATSLAEKPKQEIQYLRSTLELLHCAGDQAMAQKLLDSFHGDETNPDVFPSWARVRLLSASGQFLEAVDVGLAALDREPDSLPLQLAMAEACLGVRDPENAAAHAEEALELAGGSASTSEGSEAFLLLALACYNQWETANGMHACARVIDCAHHAPSPLLKRIVRETRMLARRFGSGDDEDE